jgi:hypothetical protein
VAGARSEDRRRRLGPLRASGTTRRRRPGHGPADRRRPAGPGGASHPDDAPPAWYLALNRARLPESKEASIDALRGSLARRGIETDGWWDPQVELCLLGALVQFGWEKALGDDDELGWWCDRARDGARWL